MQHHAGEKAQQHQDKIRQARQRTQRSSEMPSSGPHPALLSGRTRVLPRGRGSLQGGPSLLSHGSGWGLQEIPIHPPAQLDLPHPNRSISCTLGTFSNGSPVSLSDWSQCFTNSDFKSTSSGGYVPWRLVVFTDALREGWTAGALLENFSPQVLPKSLPKPLSVVRVVDVLLKLSRNAAAPHNSAARAAVQSTRQPSTEPVPRPPPHQPAICC